MSDSFSLLSEEKRAENEAHDLTIRLVFKMNILADEPVHYQLFL